MGGNFAAFLLAHAGAASPWGEGHAELYWLGAALLMVLPLSAPLIARSHDEGAHEVKRARVLTALVCVPLALSLGANDPWHAALGLVTAALATLLPSAGTSRVSGWILALAPLQVLCAMATAPSSGWLLFLPLFLVVETAALLVHSARMTSEELQHRAPPRLALAHPGAPRPRRALTERARLVPMLSLALLVLTGLIYPALGLLPGPRELLDLGGASARSADEPGETKRASEASAAAQRLFREELSPGAALSREAQSVVMLVRPRLGPSPTAPGHDLGQLYLRGACLDTFTSTGLRASGTSEPRLVRDADDRRDGWCLLDEAPPVSPVWFDVEQQSFRTPGGAWEVLFAPQPVLALRSDAVHHDPNGLLAFRSDAGPALVTYTLVSERAEWSAEALEQREARHESPRFTQLPPASRELEGVRRVAEELARGASSDYEVMQRVLRHFASEYTYSLDTRDVPGLAGIASFMRRKRGHCTSFAATATLLLRTQGLPARVATGFLAKDWSEAERRYRVTNRNGHAWIEVHFEGAGWVRFDPTPARAREQAEEAAAAGPVDGLRDWAARARADVLAWSASGAQRLELELLVETLLDLPRATLVSLEREPAALIVLGLAAGLLGVLVHVLRRGTRRVGTTISSVQARETRSLLDALQGAGERRRRGETLLEFARRLHSPAEVEALVAELYRGRFARSSEVDRAARDELRRRALESLGSRG